MASVGAEPQVVLQYLEECPRWWLAYARLLTAMRRAGLAHVEPTVHRVESIEEGLRIGFVGSPTILVNGRDPFEVEPEWDGRCCRTFRTADGIRDECPTVDQLRRVLS